MADSPSPPPDNGQEGGPDRARELPTLTEREHDVLEAVVRTYVETAEPAGSRTLANTYELGVSAATVRNTMSDLEDKGYLFHPHTSAGRMPTDRAYRYFVDRVITRPTLSPEEQDQVGQAIEAPSTAVEHLIRQAARALGLLTQELGLAVAPGSVDPVLERLELVQASSSSVLMVVTIRSGVTRTVYVDLATSVHAEVLVSLTMILNERLAGLTLREVRASLSERLRDSAPDPLTQDLLNIFIESGSDLFDWSSLSASGLHLGQASVLAAQPEFASGENLKSLLELTERQDLLTDVLERRQHLGGLQITIGAEHESSELAGFSLVTAEYRAGNLTGVIGVIGPTRMPYEKVIAIVDYTSNLVDKILRG